MGRGVQTHSSWLVIRVGRPSFNYVCAKTGHHLTGCLALLGRSVSSNIDRRGEKLCSQEIHQLLPQPPTNLRTKHHQLP